MKLTECLAIIALFQGMITKIREELCKVQFHFRLGAMLHDRKVAGHERHAKRKFFGKKALRHSTQSMSNDLAVVDMAPFNMKYQLCRAPGKYVRQLAKRRAGQ